MSAYQNFSGGPNGRAGRTWSQRLVLAGSILLAAVSLVIALVMVVVQRNLEQIKRVDTRAVPVGETRTSTPLTLESLTEGLVKTSIVDNSTGNTLAPISTVAPGTIESFGQPQLYRPELGVREHLPRRRGGRQPTGHHHAAAHRGQYRHGRDALVPP